MKEKIFKSKVEVMLGIRECRFDNLHDIIPLYTYLKENIEKYGFLSINDVFLTTYYYYKYNVLVSTTYEVLLLSKKINDKSDVVSLYFEGHAIGWIMYDDCFNIKLDKDGNYYLDVSEPHKI